MALQVQHLAAAELLELLPLALLERLQVTAAVAVRAAKAFRLERQALSTSTTAATQLALGAALVKRLEG
jgi:hypothetical protein